MTPLQRVRKAAFIPGAARDVGRSKSFETALGAMATVYAKPGSLDRVYGDFPVGVQVFLRIRPRRMQMAEHAGHMEHPDHHEHGGATSPSSHTLLSALLARELALSTGRLSEPEE